MKLSEKKYKRIVVKIGSSLLAAGKDRLALEYLGGIAAKIAALAREGKEIILVSSGAIACGMSILKLESRPKELAYLQAAAAVGQNLLMDTYNDAFIKRGLHAAQVLLTYEDFNDRRRYLNAKNTLLTLLKLGAIPVINENDTVSTDEIKFGDNDRLSALVASLVSADLLIILSDVDGLLNQEKKVVKIVDKITPAIKALACPTKGKTCVGGMITKIEAAGISIDSGIACVIANGKDEDLLLKDSEIPGTLFIPKKGYLKAKERWIAFGTKPKGSIAVDSGAKNALMNKKSLLSVGIVALDGNFETGDVVSITDKQGTEFARGCVCISAKHLEKIKGSRFEKEIIHRDNLVIL